MQRKDINVGDIVAVGNGRRYDDATAVRVRILAVGPPRIFKGKTYLVSRGGWDHTGSGIIGVRTDVEFDGVIPADADIRSTFTFSAPFWIEPRNIWETWADWETIQGQRKVRKEIAQRAEDEREQEQQAQIDHMLALVPASAWEQTGIPGRPLKFRPGATPRISVADLTILLKAARTAALAEADEQ